MGECLRRGGWRTQSTEVNVTGWRRHPRGQSPMPPNLVTQEEAEKDKCNYDSSGQHLPGASTFLHRPILDASLSKVDCVAARMRQDAESQPTPRPRRPAGPVPGGPRRPRGGFVAAVRVSPCLLYMTR